MSPNSPSQAGQQPRLVPLPDSRHSESKQGRLVGKASPDKEITVTVILKRRQPIDLPALGGRHLSRQEYTDQYGATEEAIQQVRNLAARHGLQVLETSRARRRVFLQGTVAQFEQAFGVQLQEYEHQGRRYHTFAGDLSVPETELGVVETVLGLDNRPIARPHIRFRRGIVANPNASTASFNPPQVAQIYNYPTGVNGSGECIALIELGGGYETSDIQTYFSQLGIPAPTVVAVGVDGATNVPGQDPQGADGEVALDIQVAGSIAPGARIAVYFAPNTNQGFQDAVSQAMHDTTNNPSVISISWGGPEDSWPSGALTAFDNTLQGAAALGITVTVASGDSGSSDGESGNHVDFPASSPHVLACGGTDLSASGTARKSEVVWNDQSAGGGATGGGVSAVFALPGWQQNANVPAASGSTGGRGVPDVAGDAAPETGYNVLIDGQSAVVGGTSAVAPLWAALIALINQQSGKKAGFVNPTLYGAGETDFYDVTQGNNGAFSAGPGWDPCTGLGSPNGQQVASTLAGS
jgi:kumamolisin